MIKKIAYIDDDRGHLDYFPYYIDQYAHGLIEVYTFYPKPDLESFILEILSLGVQAVVVDYRLREKDPTIKYNGTSIIKEIRRIKKDYPVFILTAYDEDAQEVASDVNLVYEKDKVFDDSGDYMDTFIKKVYRQIDKYLSKIETIELLTKDLLEQRKNGFLGLEKETQLLNYLEYLNVQNLSEAYSQIKYQNAIEKMDAIFQLLHNFEFEIATSELVIFTNQLILSSQGKARENIQNLKNNILSFLFDLQQINNRSVSEEITDQEALLSKMNIGISISREIHLLIEFLSVQENQEEINKHSNTIEISIDSEFNQFEQTEQKQIVELILENLKLSSSDLFIVGKRKGSVKLVLELPDGEQAEKLYWLIKSGKLRESGIYDAKLEGFFPRSSQNHRMDSSENFHSHDSMIQSSVNGSTKNSIKNHIKKGNIETALNELEKMIAQDEKYYNEFILYQSNYSAILKGEKLNTIGDDRIDRIKNNLIMSILKFVDELNEN